MAPRIYYWKQLAIKEEGENEQEEKLIPCCPLGYAAETAARNSGVLAARQEFRQAEKIASARVPGSQSDVKFLLMS
jgi:hypothetical protein